MSIMSRVAHDLIPVSTLRPLRSASTECITDMQEGCMGLGPSLTSLTSITEGCQCKASCQFMAHNGKGAIGEEWQEEPTTGSLAAARLGPSRLSRFEPPPSRGFSPPWLAIGTAWIRREHELDIRNLE